MTIAARRGDRACLSPITIDDVMGDPEWVRELARRNGPYEFPERPGGFIWPTWHTRWAANGELLVDDASELLNHSAFAAAAAQMYGSDRLSPEGVYVNLGTPWLAQPVMHTDLPLFRGIDKDEVPGWFLQSLGASRLFEAERINSVTAVAWFFEGDNGGFTCWPDGPAGDRLEYTNMWNTAVVGDNDFMYHRVERIGAEGTTSPEGMTASTTLDHDGSAWVVCDGDQELGRYGEHDVRLSISWKATVHDDNTDETSIDDAFHRISDVIGPSVLPGGVDSLFDDAARIELMQRWPGYLPITDRPAT